MRSRGGGLDRWEEAVKGCWEAGRDREEMRGYAESGAREGERKLRRWEKEGRGWDIWCLAGDGAGGGIEGRRTEGRARGGRGRYTGVVGALDSGSGGARAAAAPAQWQWRWRWVGGGGWNNDSGINGIGARGGGGVGGGRGGDT